MHQRTQDLDKLCTLMSAQHAQSQQQKDEAVVLVGVRCASWTVSRGAGYAALIFTKFSHLKN